MLCGVGCGALGKKSSTVAKLRKHMAIKLTHRPARPREKYEGGNDSPRKRLLITQPMATR